MKIRFSLSRWFILVLIIAGFLFLLWQVVSAAPNSNDQIYPSVGLMLILYGLMVYG